MIARSLIQLINSSIKQQSIFTRIIEEGEIMLQGALNFTINNFHPPHCCAVGEYLLFYLIPFSLLMKKLLLSADSPAYLMIASSPIQLINSSIKQQSIFTRIIEEGEIMLQGALKFTINNFHPPHCCAVGEYLLFYLIPFFLLPKKLLL